MRKYLLLSLILLCGIAGFAQPTITNISPTAAGAGATITITGTNLTGTNAISFGGTAAASFTVLSSTTVTAIVASGSSGSLSVTTGGGTATYPGFVFIPVPTISACTPLSATSGDVVTITGTDLSSVTSVSFGGTAAASFTALSATTITATVASGSSGSISVTTLGGTTAFSGFTFNLPAPPTITSFIPTAAGAGASITITGTNLSGITALSFGGTAAASFTALSPTSVTAVVAAGSSGSISITTAGGTIALSGFTFVSAPVIASFTPLTGVAGSTITITGTNLSAITAVSFGGTAAASFTALSSTTLAAVVAAGSSGSISVTGTGGTTALSGFTYIAPPVVASFSPLSGIAGSSVTIAGSGFNTATSGNVVFFGATRATVTSASATSLTVTVPQAATYAPITVLNTDNYLYAASNASFNPTYNAGKSSIATYDFTAKTDIASSGTNPTDALTGDLDGDGKPDLVIINSDNSNIAVFLNNSSSQTISFANPVIISSPTNPFTGALGDLDGDGKPDLALVELGSNNIHILLNKSTTGNLNIGPATFNWPNAVSSSNGNFFINTDNRPTSVTIADLDGDGKPDLATTNTNSGTVSVFLNTGIRGGQLSFASGLYLNTSSNTLPYYVRVNDLDKDGKPDLIIGYQQSNSNISIYRNTSTIGSLSFASRTDIAAGFTQPSLMAMAIGDIDGDGKADIAFANYANNSITVFRNTSSLGNISFASKLDFTTNSPHFITLADFDGDGKPDLAAANYLYSTVSVLRNISTTGTIAFAGGITLTTGNTPSAINATDFNSDGKPDLIVTNRGTGVNTFSLFKNILNVPVITSLSPAYGGRNDTIRIKGTNLASATTVSFGGTNALSFQASGDTLLTATLGTGASGTVNVTSAGGTAAFSGFTFYPSPTISSFTPTSATAGDLVTITGTNLSNATKISFGGTAAASFTVLSSTTITATVAAGSSGSVSVTTLGGTTALSGFSFTIPSPPTIASFTPLTGVAGSTITITGTSLSAITAVSFGGTAAASFTVLSSTTLTAVVAAGSSGSISVTGTGGTTALSGFTYIAPPVVASFSPLSGIAGSSVTIAGSGFNTATSGNVVFFGATRATVTSASATSLTVTVPQAATYAPITVLNTDNYLYAASNASFNPTYNAGKSSIATYDFTAKTDIASSGTNPTDALTGDLDGDGKPDLVIINSDNSNIAVFLNNSSSQTISFANPVIISSPTNPFTGALGDLDGDGKPDLALVELGSNNIHILLNKSTTGNLNIGPATFNWPNAVSSSNGNFFINTDNRPTSVTIADLDGDGKPDLATTNTNSGTVSVFLNTGIRGGQLSFASGLYLNTSSNTLPYYVRVNDLDKDGKPDLIIGYQQSNSNISIYRNTSTIGSLSFASRTDIAAGFTQPSLMAMAIGDIDGDGKADIAFANYANNSITVFRNTSSLGNISFASKLDFTTNSPHFITLADFDGDGKPDLAAANYLYSTVSVLRNISTTGTIAFAGGITLTTGNTPSAINATDFNSDGKPDLIVTNRGTGVNTFSLFKNILNVPVITSLSPAYGGRNDTIRIKGTNLAAATTVSFGGTNALSFQASGDTLLTATLGTGASGTVNVTSAGGTAAFSGFTYFMVTAPIIDSLSTLSGMIGSSVVISGKNFSSTPGNNIVYFGDVKANVTSATATSLTVTVPPGASYQPVSVTVNRLTGYAANPFIVTFPGGAKPFTATSFIKKTTLLTSKVGRTITTSDFDLDGKVDIAIVNNGINLVSIFRNLSVPGVDSFGSKSDLALSPEDVTPSLAITPDLNGDGKPDLVVTQPAFGKGATSIFRNTSSNGNISFASRVDSITGLGTLGVTYADLDGDGKPELIVQSNLDVPSLTRVVIIYKNTSTNDSISFGTKMYLYPSDGAAFTIARDIDGDGKPDIITSNSTSGTISVFRNTSSGGNISFAPKIDFDAGKSPSSITSGDMDGDGLADIVLINNLNTLPGTLDILRNTSTPGNISFSPKTEMITGIAPQEVSLSDMDGDGKPDIAVSNYGDTSNGSNFFSVWRNLSSKGNLLFDKRADYPTDGIFTGGIHIADLNADGKPDIIIANQLNSTVSLFMNRVTEPKLLGFSPAMGAQNDTITITGRNLTGSSAVTIGGTSVKSFTVVNDSLISAITGSGASGYVSVKTPYGTDSLPGFTYGLPEVVISDSTKTNLILNSFINTYSTAQYFIVTGKRLVSNIIVKVDSANNSINPKFLISLSPDAGFNTLISLTPNNNKVDSTKIYVRFKSAVAGSFADNISIAATRAVTRNISLTGSVCDSIILATPLISSISKDSIICTRDSVLLSSTAISNRYKWSTGDTTKNIVVRSSATITLQIGSTPGCYSLSSATIKIIKNLNPVPVIAISGDTKLISSSASNYRWYYNNLLLPNETNSSLTASKIGFYKVETSLDKTCWDASQEVAIVMVSTPLVNDTLKVIVYPNPAASGSTFYVVGTLQKVTNVVAKLTIADATGNVVVQSSKFIFFGREIKIPVSLSTKGTYFVKLDVNGDVKTQTVIIQ